MHLLVLAFVLLLGSGFVALALSRRPVASGAVGTLGAVAACAVAAVPAVQALLSGRTESLSLPWGAPVGDLLLGLDPLSAFFLLPLLLLSALTAIYGRPYLLAYRDHKSLGPPTFAFNLLVASMVGVLLARGAVLFLVSWEVMTLAAYVLVTFEHEEPEVRRAGWVYLVAAHVGVVCLLALFLTLGAHAGSLDFAAFAAMPRASGGFAFLVFVLALVGFGVKAGLVPLHVWLPEAHAAAPSHVSALMSGVLVKLGLYGVLRMLTLLTPAFWWGPVLITLGLAGGVLGIALALHQRDLKRVLAYSTVENMGLITAGVGVAFWGQSQGNPVVAALGACGALLHVWNHALMKGLMFLSAGSVLHGTGTRDLEKLGGLMKRMPRTAVAMLVGAVAIAGLPPLNGFVSEWLLYLGFLHGSRTGSGVVGVSPAIGVGILSFIGGLAALCFVRLVSIALLGTARSPAAREAHESSAGLVGPLWVLMLCLAVGAALPGSLVQAFARVVGQVFGASVLAQVEPLQDSLATLGLFNVVLLGTLVLAGALWARFVRTADAPIETWGCGYAGTAPRAQYTARSFSELLVSRLLPSFFRAVAQKKKPDALFPANGQFLVRSGDPLIDRIYEPFFSRMGDWFSRLRWLQQGALHIYLLYILVVLLGALAWMSWRAWMGT
ncbi:MAG TPA: proton-conducting transporter membrane subunit [Myxococcales bacterium]